MNRAIVWKFNNKGNIVSSYINMLFMFQWLEKWLAWMLYRLDLCKWSISESQCFSLPSVRPWAIYLTFLCFSFLVYKMRINYYLPLVVWRSKQWDHTFLPVMSWPQWLIYCPGGWPISGTRTKIHSSLTQGLMQEVLNKQLLSGWVVPAQNY